MRLILNWLLGALALMIVGYLVPGVYVRGITSALIAAVIIGFVNATLGLFLKIITFPLTVLTLGIFWFVINAIMLEIASALLRPNFEVATFGSAFIGAIILALVNMLLRWMVGPPRRAEY